MSADLPHGQHALADATISATQAADAVSRRITPDRMLALLHDKRARFILVGILNTAFAFAVFTCLELTVGKHIHYLVNLLITHVLAVIEAFTLQRWLVFKVKGNLLMDLLRFESVNLGALGFNLLALPVLVEAGKLPVLLAEVVVLGVVVTGTYLGHKHFSFRRKSEATA